MHSTMHKLQICTLQCINYKINFLVYFSWLEALSDKQVVGGPIPPTKIVVVVQLAEHWVVVPNVASSNLVGHLYCEYYYCLFYKNLFL